MLSALIIGDAPDDADADADEDAAPVMLRLGVADEADAAAEDVEEEGWWWWWCTSAGGGSMFAPRPPPKPPKPPPFVTDAFPPKLCREGSSNAGGALGPCALEPAMC
tara:strand:- start:21 stop:341 length:321 start_codon:yes stop_codon:yes gene_type:complete